MQAYILAIDQGTTNSRAILFDHGGNVISQHEMALTQYFPQEGWVEQDPVEMYENTVVCCRETLKKSNLSAKLIAGIGISNQRETTIIWDKATGIPIYPAIVWQDRRTSDLCRQLIHNKLQSMLQEKTGLVVDPYFSATKIMWILANVQGARTRAEKGELLFGTVDTFLLWKLTNGKSHATDATNASRTMLFNIHTQTWDTEILAALNIPAQLLPAVLDNAANFGVINQGILGESIPIGGMAGDQQAALIGQACFAPGMVKATYGTGGFILLNTGKKAPVPSHQLLTTVAYRLANVPIYGIEGSIFCAGAIVKWLRDTLKIIHSAADTENLARAVPSTGGVYLVPAFTGLGAPYWDPDARGALLGLTRNSKREHIVRAALESVAYQTRDLLLSMTDAATLKALRVDGGMAANQWLLQFIADILRVDVHRPLCIETTALGVAFLAGLQTGVYQSLTEIASLWQMYQRYQPIMQTSEADKLYQGWQAAVSRVLTR